MVVYERSPRAVNAGLMATGIEVQVTQQGYTPHNATVQTAAELQPDPAGLALQRGIEPSSPTTEHEFAPSRTDANTPQGHAESDVGGERNALDGKPQPDRSPPAVETPGVYFIQAEQGGLIKIGVASSVRLRFRNIQCMCPVPLVLLGYIEGADAGTERWLHGYFAKHRRHGEWFEPTDELLDIAHGRADWLRGTMTASEAATALDVRALFVSKRMGDLEGPPGPRGGARFIERDVVRAARLVEQERVEAATKAALRIAAKRIAEIAAVAAVEALEST